MNLTEFADVCGTDKGTHQGFMPLYGRYLPAWDKMTVLVELGVYEGGSMRLWGRHFAHPGTRIIGIDIDLSHCPDKNYFEPNVELYQGDQADPALTEHLEPTYGADVVIDDASHFSSKTIASFHTWWPHVRPGGLYVVEDTHCSYNTDHYGDREAAPPVELPTARAPRFPRMQVATTMEFLKRLADDVNWNYHGFDRFNPMYRDIGFVHFFPGITFIGKASK